MSIVVFGLTISFSWGNSHATLWRALCRVLVRRGHHITFFTRDATYYYCVIKLLPDLTSLSYSWGFTRIEAARVALTFG
jgi:hypothetical protein